MTFALIASHLLCIVIGGLAATFLILSGDSRHHDEDRM